MAPPAEHDQPGSNRLLTLLPLEEHARVVANLESVALPRKQILARPDEAYTHVLFPCIGVVSVLVPMGEEQSVEAAVIGFEGMVGVPIVLGVDRGPHEVITQVSGRGQRMPVRRFQELLRECPGLRAVSQRYALAFMNQTARSSACNRMHEIHQRLARWLLLVHDRVDGDEFGLTQEYLSEMLGVRRPSVSLAARTLHNGGLIDYRWGQIRILDRRGLEDAACDDYRQTVTEYENLFAPRVFAA
jgi:CRP-like cAMP-binding protein